MAKTLKNHVMMASSRASTYPWKDWFDGQTWELTQGEDFKPTIISFRGTIFAMAKRKGFSVQTRSENGKKIIIKATKKEVEKNALE